MKQFFAYLGALLFLPLRLVAAEADPAPVSFTKEIAPLLVAKCLGCHNAEKAKGKYRLHTFEAMMMAGGSEERPVIPGDAGASKFYQLLVATNEDDRMPQKDEALGASQIALVKRWIDQGARLDHTNRNELIAVLAAPVHPAAPRIYRTAMPVTALAFNASGDRLAASGYHEITIWSSDAGKLEHRLGNMAEKTLDLAFSPDGRWLASASGTPGKIGEVRLFNTTNGELAAVLATLADAALCVTFSPDGKRLAAGGADNVIRIWDVESRKLVQTIEQHADWVSTLAFSPDGQLLASGSRDKSARVFTASSGELEETYTGHGDFVTAIHWIDGKSVMSVPRTGPAHRWSAENAKKSGELSGWNAEPTRMMIRGTNIFIASFDAQVRQYEVRSNQLVRTLAGHQDAIYALALHEPSRRVASGSHDGEVRIWGMDDGELRVRFVAAPGYTPTFSRAP